MDFAFRRMNRVAVGVDLSPASISAAKWVAEWLEGDTEMVLVLAVAPGASAGLFERRAAEQRLRHIARDLAVDFVWCEVRAGQPADVILAVAREFHVDLVAVGAPHAVRDIGADARVVEHLINQSEVPVIVCDASGPLDNRSRPNAVNPDGPSLMHVLERAARIPRASARTAAQ